MKFFACLLALPAVLLSSLAAPVADQDLVASSDGQDTLAYPDRFNLNLNLNLKSQGSINKSLNRREDLESGEPAERNFGLGPLKNFTWHLQMHAEEIHGICQTNYQYEHFPNFDVQGQLVNKMGTIISFLQAADLSKVERNYKDYHQEYRQPEVRKLLVQNVELVGGMVTHIVHTKPLNNVLDPLCRDMLKAMFEVLRPLWPLIHGSIRSATIRLEAFLHDVPGWRNISNILDEMLEELELSR